MVNTYAISSLSMFAVTVFWRLRRRLAKGVLRGTSFLKSKPTTLGDRLCEVNRDAVTWLTLHRRKVRAESARRLLGDERGMMVPTRLLRQGSPQMPVVEYELVRCMTVGGKESKGREEKRERKGGGQERTAQTLNIYKRWKEVLKEVDIYQQRWAMQVLGPCFAAHFQLFGHSSELIQ